jgi:TonB family protein
LHDRQHLNDPAQVESALQELIALAPDNLDLSFRLARAQEDQERFDTAEDTLIQTRRRAPDAVEPVRMLAQFYARRATALANRNKPPAPPPPGSGLPDADGAYRVGGPITPARRLGNPEYPIEAQAAGIAGIVIAEIVVDEQGLVTDARILRSIPLLDDAALRAVREWRYAPTIVNGRAVPIKMTVTVNFSNR